MQMKVWILSDIRLIMLGSVIIFAGFMVGGIRSSYYAQFVIQANQFDDCYDYSTGNQVKVKCSDVTQESFLYLLLSITLIGIGGVIIFKGIKGKWDQNVKNDEMLGPKNP